MELVDFTENVATNVAADWVQAMVAPIGIVGWKICQSAWKNRSSEPSRFKLDFSFFSGLRRLNNWISIALFPLVFVPYSIAAMIWFSPILLFTTMPFGHLVKNSEGNFPSWLTLPYVIGSMVPVCLITYNRLFNSDNPVRATLRLYIDGISVWLIMIIACSSIALLAVPIAILARISNIGGGSQDALHLIVFIYTCATAVVCLGWYWIACLCIAQGRLFPKAVTTIKKVAAVMITPMRYKRSVKASEPTAT